MAHFAQLNENSIVVNVIVIANDAINNLPFPDSEPVGVALCHQLYGTDTIWKQTSYHGNFRGKYAAEQDVYDPIQDIFFSPNNPTPSPSLTI